MSPRTKDGLRLADLLQTIFDGGVTDGRTTLEYPRLEVLVVPVAVSGAIMPTWFGRRYMRAGPTGTEVVIGIVVLLVLAGIVGAAIVATTRPQEPLFELRVERGGGVAREETIAAQMLPGIGTAGWGLVEAPEVLDRSELLAAEETQLLDAGATYVYRGVYANRTTGESVSVEIVDVGTPAKAFGLYGARRPPGARALPMGNDGWQTEDGGAFWSGRYYTEFNSSGVRGDTPSAMTIADALGSVQIRYGTPFWAEHVLPAEGRIAGSFSYAFHRAVGFEFLEDTFSADYEGGVTAFVTEAASSSQAVDLVRRFESFLTEQGRVQAQPTEPEGGVLAGDFAGWQLAVFRTGARVYGVLGQDMEPVSELAKRMLDSVQPRTGAVAQAGQVEEKVSPFPAIDVDGWDAPAETREYTPLNLWEKIDGRAEIYLQLDMQSMHFGTYRDRNDADRAIDVFWYTMAESDGAFGIYRAEASGHAPKIDVGNEGYGSDGNVTFWKGRDYVRVEALGEGGALEAAGSAIARAIAERIEGTGETLWADAVLPREGRTEEDLAYHGANAFSLDFLAEVFSADYAAEGMAYTMFIHRAVDAVAAQSLLEAYEAFFVSYGQVLERGRTEEGIEFVVGESGGIVDAAFVVDVYLGGVNNTDDAALAKA
ncbi:MAG: hypothetical protein GY842_12440, partial [bacterium]|nr:hypothetical protein [bacterium]